MSPSDAATLVEARDWLRTRLDDGDDCPLCQQRVRVYRRKLNHHNVRVLAAMHRKASMNWVHLPSLMRTDLPDIAHQGGHATIAAYWGLIAEAGAERADGGRAGWWRLTPFGAAWLRGESTVPKYARVYNGRVLNTVGDPVTVTDVLGQRGFSLTELLAGA